MAKLLEKVLDFVGWESNDPEEDIYEDEAEDNVPSKYDRNNVPKRGPQGKVLNMNNNNNLEVVILSPQNIQQTCHYECRRR